MTFLKPLVPESLMECIGFLALGEEEVEERDDSTLKLGAAAGVNGRRRERLPNNRLTDVRRDEQGNARAKTVALLEQFVEENDDKRCGDQLDNEE